MINQDQFDYVIKNLSERGFIKKFRDGWLFTEKGENYTSKRSGNSWLRISYAPTNLWVPSLFHINEPMREWVWGFTEFYEIKEDEYIALCEYFEIPLEKENQVILDDEEDFVV